VVEPEVLPGRRALLVVAHPGHELGVPGVGTLVRTLVRLGKGRLRAAAPT